MYTHYNWTKLDYTFFFLFLVITLLLPIKIKHYNYSIINQLFIKEIIKTQKYTNKNVFHSIIIRFIPKPFILKLYIYPCKIKYFPYTIIPFIKNIYSKYKIHSNTQKNLHLIFLILILIINFSNMLKIIHTSTKLIQSKISQNFYTF